MKYYFVFLYLTVTALMMGIQPAQADNLTFIAREGWAKKAVKPDLLIKHTNNKITTIVIHHTDGNIVTSKKLDDEKGSMEGWLNDHMVEDHHWGDLAYHYVIGPSGRVYVGREEQYIPDSGTPYDRNGKLCICLMGNFDKQEPTPEALKTLAKLASDKANEYKLGKNDVIIHGDIADSTCPGKSLKKWFKDGGLAKIQELIK